MGASFSDELEIVLKKQLDVLMEMKDISYEKTDIIVQDDTESLEKLTREEEGLINKMGTVEEERLRLIDSWGLNMDISMSTIIEKVPKGADKLEIIRDKLEETLAAIQERNSLNAELIEDNLQWLDFNMNLISNSQSPLTYGKDNKNKSNSSLFDRKV